MAEPNPFVRTQPKDFRLHQCVTLNAELKARMKAYSSYINWSVVATTAWESVLHDIAASTKENEYARVMEGTGKTLERIRAGTHQATAADSKRPPERAVQVSGPSERNTT